ncbi:uncharacterized protein LOC142493147 [Ascaphus truei]
MESSVKIFIIEAIRYILTHNYFSHDGCYYLQTCGTAMGTRFAPSYANIFMGMWEENYILNHNPYGANLVLWKRYIDDVLCVWKGTKEDLEAFKEHLNTNDYNIQFTFSTSPQSINFLDLTLYTVNNEIHTKTYYKEVNANSYVLASSHHHPHWLKNIPKLQALRVKRNCSQLEVYKEQIEDVGNKFKDRKYNGKVVKNAIEQANNTERASLIHPVKKVAANANKVFLPFITQFNGMSREISKVFNKHWGILQRDPILQSILPDKPQIVYKKAQNLKSQLAPSCPKKHQGLGQTMCLKELKGYFPCKKCIGCSYGSKCKEFKSNVTGKSFEIRSFINCKSNFCIYLLECPCKLQYVGRTGRPLKRRFVEHVYNIKNGLETHSVSNHFKLHHNQSPEGLTCIGIDCPKVGIRGGDRLQRVSQQETFWIYTLKTLSPKGLNIDFDLASFL